MGLLISVILAMPGAAAAGDGETQPASGSPPTTAALTATAAPGLGRGPMDATAAPGRHDEMRSVFHRMERQLIPNFFRPGQEEFNRVAWGYCQPGDETVYDRPDGVRNLIWKYRPTIRLLDFFTWVSTPDQ